MFLLTIIEMKMCITFVTFNLDGTIEVEEQYTNGKGRRVKTKVKVFQSGPDALKYLTYTVRKNTMLINAFEVSADDFYTDDDLFFNLTSDELQRLHRLQVFSDQYMAFYLKYAFSEELPENGL